MKRIVPGLLCAVLLSGVTAAQKSAVPGAETPQATTVDSEEIRAAVERNNADAFSDTVLREVYQIVEGKGVLVTGGTIESPAPLPSNSAVVRQAIGPSSPGKVIRGGTRRNVGPGDSIVIPPHTAHGFVEITTPRIVYTVIRIDSQRLLELREKAD